MEVENPPQVEPHRVYPEHGTTRKWNCFDTTAYQQHTNKLPEEEILGQVANRNASCGSKFVPLCFPHGNAENKCFS